MKYIEEFVNLIYQGVDLGEWLVINKNGDIKNPKTGTIRKQNVGKTGYYFISISMGNRNKKKTIRTHKALAETFIPNPENKPIPNHIDGNKLNNDLSNLEWCTHKENSEHARDIGLLNVNCGVNSSSSKLSKEDLNYIRNNYKPRDKEFGARALGRKFNIRHSNILKVIKNISYKYD